MGRRAKVVRIEVADERIDDFLATYDLWFEQFHREAGTEVYTLDRDVDNPRVFWCYEVFRDDAAVDEHNSSDLLARTLPEFQTFVNYERFWLQPVRAKGLPGDEPQD